MTLINAHTHLEFTLFAGLCPTEPVDFVPWLRTVIASRAQRKSPDGLALQKAIESGIQMLLDAGTTHVGDISQTRLSVEPLLASGLSGVVYLEVLGLEVAKAIEWLEQTQREIDGYRRHENAMRVGLTIHAPYSCAPDLLEAGARWCREHDVPLCVHAAESPAEAEVIQYGTGDFRDLLEEAELPIPPIPGKSPVAYLDDLGVLDAGPLLVHMVQVDDDDIARVRRSGATIAHCPRSNTLLNCGRMPLEKYLAAGIPVSMGTDSLSSSPSLDVREEVEAAVVLHEGIVATETVRGLLAANPFQVA